VVTAGPQGYINLQAGYAIETSGQARIDTHTLYSQAGYGIHLATRVDWLTAGLSGSGDITINETDDIGLLEILIFDGAVDILAGGDVTVGRIISMTDAENNDVSITSTNGNIMIDLIRVGKSHGRIFVESETGSIREVDTFDPDADLVGYYGYLKAMTIIGSLTDTNLNLEFDLSILEIEAYDLIVSKYRSPGNRRCDRNRVNNCNSSHFRR
jgi:hypothetical protein